MEALGLLLLLLSEMRREVGALALLEREEESLMCGTNWTDGRRGLLRSPRVGRRQAGMKGAVGCLSGGWEVEERGEGPSSRAGTEVERGEGVVSMLAIRRCGAVVLWDAM